MARGGTNPGGYILIITHICKLGSDGSSEWQNLTRQSTTFWVTQAVGFATAAHAI